MLRLCAVVAVSWLIFLKSANAQTTTKNEGIVSCPVLDCGVTDIPTECQVIPEYPFLGQVCYGCPELNPNCSTPANASRGTPAISNTPANTTSEPGTGGPESAGLETTTVSAIPASGFYDWGFGMPVVVEGTTASPDTTDTIALDMQNIGTAASDNNTVILDAATNSSSPDVLFINATETEANITMLDANVTTMLDILNNDTTMDINLNASEALEQNVSVSLTETPTEITSTSTPLVDPVNAEVLTAGFPVTIQPEPIDTATNNPFDAFTNSPVLTTPTPISCPVLACPLEFIPPECMVIGKFEVNGRTCEGCPTWKDSCRRFTMDPVNPTTTPGPLPTPTKCPAIACTMEYIPPVCREETTFIHKGIVCQGCQKWKAGCRDATLPDIGLQPEPDIECPLMDCPPTNIPQECAYVETYQFMGKTCKKCPIRMQGCLGDRRPKTPCPLQACPMRFIPDECSEVPTYDYKGQKCSGCPRYRSGCRVSTSGRQQENAPPSEVCPLLACKMEFIPEECRELTTYIVQGKTCQGCPRKRKGCVASAEAVKNVISDSEVIRTEIACPLQVCPINNIPNECREVTTIDFMGRKCPGCPRFRDGCLPNPRPPRIPEMACPIQACPMIYIPPECKESVFFDFRGKICEGCPKMRENCMPEIFPQTTTEKSIPDTGCPLQACPLIFIQNECKDVPLFKHEGRICEGCPKYRDGCVPFNSPSFGCPMFDCPPISIPEGCREVPTFELNGKVCNGCPKQKKDCVLPLADKTDSKSNLQCPLQACPMIYIPPECREVPQFEFQGKMCDLCPRMRKDCQALPPPPPIFFPKPLKPCPPQPCPMLFIPANCREETYFQFEGRTCTGCPKFKDGCVPGNNANLPCPLQACPLINIPPGCRESTTFKFRGKTCPGCPKIRDVCQVGQRLESDIVSPTLFGDNVGPPLINDNVGPPLLNDKVGPPLLNDNVGPPLLDDKVGPPLLTDNVGPPLIDDKVGPPLLTDNVGPPLIDDKVGPPLLTDNVGPPLIDDKVGPPLLTDNVGPPLIDDKVGPPLLTDNVGPPLIDDKVGPPLLTDNVGPPLIDDKVGPPLFDGPPLDKPRSCPVLACPSIHIPAECREIPMVNYGGRMCAGCPVFKEGCVPREELPDCKLPCPFIYIPEPCREFPIITDNGRRCRGCPRRRENCTVPDGNNIGGSLIDPNIPCPVYKCAMTGIPVECQEASTFEFNGKLCPGCPLLIEGCGVTPDIIACPTLDCREGSSIPAECREVPVYDFRGKPCEGCPTRREGCGLIDPLPTAEIKNKLPIIGCPLLQCADAAAIPLECRNESTFEFMGRQCTGCPTRIDGCGLIDPLPTIPNRNTFPDVACPLLDCTESDFIPPECRERQTYTFMGRMCDGCSTRKIGCSPVIVQPIACPKPKCGFIRIPQECVEVPTYTFMGSVCEGCPRRKENCTELSSNVSNGNSDPTVCPVPTCPLFIPEKCQVKQYYKFKGLTCEACPKRSKSRLCRGAQAFDTDNSAPGNSVVACPTLSCPTEVIPQECREQATYTFQGKQCLRCPQWRNGCIPKACPRLSCPNVNIPRRCQEKQQYDYHGKTCYGCPQRRKNCSATDTAMANSVPVNPFLAAILEAQRRCPTLNCPENNIPLSCQVPTTYRFRGQVCPGCPIWRNGCATQNNNNNMGGLIAYSLFSEMMLR